MSKKCGFSVARLVTKGRPQREDPRWEHARAALLFACKELKNQRKKVTVLQTPGGFLRQERPLWHYSCGKESQSDEFRLLTEDLELFALTFIGDRLLHALKNVTRFVTFGIDISSSEWAAHAELVGTFDVKTDKFIYWTGKSYPTGDQMNDLIYCTDYETHFQRLENTKVMVLGCHDLNIFSPRVSANKRAGSDKSKVIYRMKRLAVKFKPAVVLQHPHETDTANIWRLGWVGVSKILPQVKTYSSAVNYSYWGGKPRKKLDKVLAGTKAGDVLDVVVP